MSKLKISPVIALFFFAPFYGEVLVGSTGPIQFFTPLIILLEGLLYGCGALLVRELVVRWKGSALSLLFVGMAYGIYEEGLDVGSFFDPNWQDLGWLKGYGRSFGTNWPWAVHLTFYHAIHSIFLSVLIISLLYPERRFQPWLTKKTLVLNVLGFIGILLFSRHFYYHLSIGEYFGCFVGIGILIAIAYFVRRIELKPLKCKPKLVSGVAFLIWLLYFLIAFGALPHLLPEVTICLLLGIGFSLFVLIGRVMAAKSEEIELNLVIGMTSLFILLDLVSHAKPGIFLVGVAVGIGMLYLRKMVLGRRPSGQIA